MTIELTLLGGFGLTRAGQPVAVPAPARRLLAALALRGPHPRPLLAGLLWPERPERRARANLRSTLWRLHRCGVAVTGGEDDHLRLPPDVRVDVDHLGRLAAGRASSVRPDLLPGWDDDWVVAERERVRHEVMHALERAAGDALARGDAGSALEWARAAVRAGPLRESAHRLVVLAHLAAGDADRARRHFEAARDLLRRESGVEPTDRFRRLLVETSAALR